MKFFMLVQPGIKKKLLYFGKDLGYIHDVINILNLRKGPLLEIFTLWVLLVWTLNVHPELALKQ